MIATADLPHVNAALNFIAAVLLFGGWRAIRAQRVDLHRRLMMAAFAVSCLFLVSYVVYHLTHGSTRFGGQGPVRTVYFLLLVTHVVLAAAVPPLAIVTLARALHGDLVSHRRLARVTFPVWMYVSVTGVVIYEMLKR